MQRDATQGPFLRGARAIGQALGLHYSTAWRYARAGLIPVVGTRPMLMLRAAVPAYHAALARALARQAGTDVACPGTSEASTHSPTRPRAGTILAGVSAHPGGSGLDPYPVLAAITPVRCKKTNRFEGGVVTIP